METPERKTAEEKLTDNLLSDIEKLKSKHSISDGRLELREEYQKEHGSIFNIPKYADWLENKLAELRSIKERLES